MIRKEGLLITTSEAKGGLLKLGAIDPDSLTLPFRDAANRRLAERLKRPIRVKIVSRPLAQALDELCQAEVRFDRVRITLRDMACDASLDARDEALDSVLRRVFGPAA